MVVHSTSDSLVDLCISLFQRAENDLGGNRTPDLFCSVIKDWPLSHSVRKNDFGRNQTPDFFCSLMKDRPLSHQQ